MPGKQQNENIETDSANIRMAVSSNAPSHPGGAERYAIDLAHGLAKRGFETTYFASHFRTLGLVDPSIKQFPIRGTAFLPRLFKENVYSHKVKKAKNKVGVDVLVACNTVVAADIAMCGGTHIGFLKAIQKTASKRDSRKIKLESRMYEQSSLIMAHSNLMRQELLNLYGLPDEKICVLYPPVDHKRFSLVSDTKRQELREAHGFKDSEVVLLFPSSSHSRKGLDLVLAAVERIGHPLVLAVAGKEPEVTSERLRYLGYVDEIQTCYQAADFAILAPLYEPFGLVGVESVLCGTPVIFPDNVGCNEVLDETARYIFEPANLDGLYSALTAILQKRENNPKSLRVVDPKKSILYDYKIESHVNEVIKMANFCIERK